MDVLWPINLLCMVNSITPWLTHCFKIFKIVKIKHPAASYGVLTALFKLLSLASLRTKERGIKPEEIKSM